MPVNPTYPGVYIEELANPVKTIVGVKTSVTAFIGRASEGPKDVAITIHSFEEYVRVFGGLSLDSHMGYAVYQYFLNGGSDAVILAIDDEPKVVVYSKRIGGDGIYLDPNNNRDPASPEFSIQVMFRASNPGNSGKNLSIYIEKNAYNNDLFNLYVKETIYRYLKKNKGTNIFTNSDLGENDKSNNISILKQWLRLSPTLETHINISFSPDHPRFIDTVLQDSKYIRRQDKGSASRIAENPDSILGLYQMTFQLNQQEVNGGSGIKVYQLTNDISTETENNLLLVIDPSNSKPLSPDSNLSILNLVDSNIDLKGTVVDENKIFPIIPSYVNQKRGIHALDNVDIFNMLCILPIKDNESISWNAYSQALGYLEQKNRRAVLIVDPPIHWTTKSDPQDLTKGIDGEGQVVRHKNAAIYYPRIKAPDPLKENRLRDFVPCGAVAGVMARTDGERGVWKAAAGVDAKINGVSDLTLKLSDEENGELNPIGVNCLRVMPPYGILVWGARTLRGADQLVDQWKYLPVRRLALYIEESLYRGTQWVVFEPNDEPLWAQIRLNVGAFMHDLFRKGAFQGSNPKDAYMVKCDHDTTTQTDIDRGIVNILVGFQPLKPAEFVILQIQQLAGQQGVS